VEKDVQQYLLEISNAASVEQVWALLCDRMAYYGFDRLIYGFTRFMTPTSFGDPNDFVVLTNHSPEYRKGFVEDGLYRSAPMVRWALENEGFSSWRAMAERINAGDLTKDELEVVTFNLAHKVLAGYTVSFKSLCARSKGAISLTARADLSQDDVDRIWATHGTNIHLLNNVAHLKILTLPVTLSNKQLTPRQREALQWVGDGKTMQDIAQIMGLTQATIEKHLRLARETLNVETTAQAVAKAAFQNQMFVMEPV
jgi:LuxR family transcriptional regulator